MGAGPKLKRQSTRLLPGRSRFDPEWTHDSASQAQPDEHRAFTPADGGSTPLGRTSGDRAPTTMRPPRGGRVDSERCGRRKVRGELAKFALMGSIPIARSNAGVAQGEQSVFQTDEAGFDSRHPLHCPHSTTVVQRLRIPPIPVRLRVRAPAPREHDGSAPSLYLGGDGPTPSRGSDSG